MFRFLRDTYTNSITSDSGEVEMNNKKKHEKVWSFAGEKYKIVFFVVVSPKLSSDFENVNHSSGTSNSRKELYKMKLLLETEALTQVCLTPDSTKCTQPQSQIANSKVLSIKVLWAEIQWMKIQTYRQQKEKKNTSFRDIVFMWLDVDEELH